MLFNGGMDPNLNNDYDQQIINQEPNVIGSIPIKQNGKPNKLVPWGLIFSFLFPFLGLIICVISLIQMNKRGETGRGLAFTGIIISVFLQVAPFMITYVINNYYSDDFVKTNHLKPACKMRDEDGKYESEDGIIKCEDNVCVYDNGNGRIVLTCK